MGFLDGGRRSIMRMYGLNKNGLPGYSRNRIFDLEIPIKMGMAMTSLVSATGYVFGSLGSGARTAFGLAALPVAYDGVIKHIDLVLMSSAGGSATQNLTLYRNGVSVITLGNISLLAGAVRMANFKNLNIYVKRGDYLEFNFSAGANTTNAVIDGSVFIKPRPTPL